MPMRLDAMQFYEKYESPEEWARIVTGRGYRAVSSPVDHTAPIDEARAYREAAERNDLVIAEVGVWRNTCTDDEAERRENLATAKAMLHLADELGARCAVNIAGARTRRGGPDDLTPEAFDRVVETVREIIDAVNPTRTYYCLETMAYMLPDSVEVYAELLRAVDRERFAAHCDPVNLCVSPRVVHANGDLIRHFFATLGPRIRSCHAKDVHLSGELTVHISEVMPAQGVLDYPTYLREINRLDPEMPLMIEHLASDAAYREAAAYIRGVEERP
jgi:sugar phosphate isomerase/epimerase